MSDRVNTVSDEGTLFDDSNLDEMQKTENYKIAYRLMQNYWIVSFAASLGAAYWGSAADNRALSAMGFLACLLAILFRLEYSLNVSKKGVMSPKYAETMAKKGSLVCAAVLMGFVGAICIAALVCHWGGTTLALFVLAELSLSMMLTECLCARRNQRVLEKSLTEEAEENETDKPE